MSSSRSNPWPYRFAVATLIAVLPLVLFGGTVTTLRAGMAESGWIFPDGFFLWMYPLEMRVRNVGVFVEHHHREFGSLVGMLSIATCLSAWWSLRGRVRWLPLLGLLAVSAQGAIGGFRVLENSPQLAFLHGAFAHAVIALLAVIAVVLSPRWREQGAQELREVRGSDFAGGWRFAFAVTALVYAQIVVGAFYRHGHHPLALTVHIMLALAVAGAMVHFGTRLRALPERFSWLRAAGKRLIALVVVQIALGVLATAMIFEVSGGPRAEVSAGEAVFATLHVAVGAFLLAQSTCAALWVRRLTASAEVPAAVPADAGGAR